MTSELMKQIREVEAGNLEKDKFYDIVKELTEREICIENAKKTPSSNRLKLIEKWAKKIKILNPVFKKVMPYAEEENKVFFTDSHFLFVWKEIKGTLPDSVKWKEEDGKIPNGKFCVETMLKNHKDAELVTVTYGEIEAQIKMKGHKENYMEIADSLFDVNYLELACQFFKLKHLDLHVSKMAPAWSILDDDSVIILAPVIKRKVDT